MSHVAGMLEDRMIRCRTHGMRFDLATGCMPGDSGFGVRARRIEREHDCTVPVLPDTDLAGASP